jgi:SAM-dependent methyltransferase
MKLTKVSTLHEIYLLEKNGGHKNMRKIRYNGKILYRFMERLYIPDHVYNLKEDIVKELNNIREKYEMSIIDKVFNDLVIRESLTALQSEIKPDNIVNILDFGCGNGYAGEFIKSFFPESRLFGSDIRKPIEKKRLSVYNDFVVARMDANLPFSGDFFNVILAYFVFHFRISDFQLDELKRVIKPQGILFFNLINSTDFSILDRLTDKGFTLIKEQEFTSVSNSCIGYFYKVN